MDVDPAKASARRELGFLSGTVPDALFAPLDDAELADWECASCHEDGSPLVPTTRPDRVHRGGEQDAERRKDACGDQHRPSAAVMTDAVGGEPDEHEQHEAEQPDAHDPQG